MEVNRHRLAARISTTLRAKQFLVFYAILLFGIDFAVPLLALWTYSPHAFADLLADARTPFSIFIDAPDPLSIAVVLSGVLLISWLRCGYIRSIVGRMHYGPTNALQFISMLGILLITDLVQLGLDELSQAVGSVALSGMLVGLVQLAAYLLLLYADYAVVISDVDPITALRRSFHVVRANVTMSLVILLSVTVLSIVIAMFIDPAINGTLARSLGLVVVRTVAMGAVAFIADVALIMIYIDTAERGALRPQGLA
jgi:hypothetical protein